MAGKIDPMHQFTIEPIAGSFQGHNPFVFTNSALWLLIVLGTIYVFMLGGMRRALIPGRWQVAVEGLTGFVASMVDTSIGPEGRKYMPWVFTAFIFILFANLMGAMPFGVVPGAHPFTVTSQFTVTGVMSLISFGIVLGVGFYKHGLHFLSLFVPKDTPFVLKLLITPIEFVSTFLVRPFTLAVRLLANMIAGHLVLAVFFLGAAYLVENPVTAVFAIGSFAAAIVFVLFELLVAALQAYIFTILNAVYLAGALEPEH